MPEAAYTGHSDHEFVAVDQLRLNLMMQAAMLVELAVDRRQPVKRHGELSSG